jgi:hypothetical protein
MSSEHIQNTPPAFISDDLDSIIDKTIRSITMTLLSRLGRPLHTRLETSNLSLFTHRILFAEEMKRLSRTVAALTALTPIMTIREFECWSVGRVDI